MTHGQARIGGCGGRQGTGRGGPRPGRRVAWMLAGLCWLSFVPSRPASAQAPGGGGTTVLAGHRDTHFAFLRHLAPGDPLLLEMPDGRTVRYRVVESAVVHARDARVAADVGVDRLALATCWPFDVLRPGTDLRYVVLSEREAEGRAPGISM